MLFKSETIIFLQRNGMVVANPHQSPVRLAFPDGYVVNLEVANRQQLLNSCQKFLEDSGLKGRRAVIVLDYSVVFEKVIALDKSGQPDKLLQGFVDAMPFEAGKRVCLGVEDGSSLYLYATNTDLYTVIEEALHQAGASSVSAVVPISAYKLPEAERTITAATARILKDGSIRKRANFRDSAAM